MNFKNARAKMFLRVSIIFLFVAVLGITLHAETVTKIRVVDGGLPTVSFSEIPAGTQVLSLQSCQSAQYNSVYLAQIQTRVPCWTGYANAKVLVEKINDIKISLDEIDKRLVSLEKTKVYIDGLKDLNGLSLMMIPAGKPEPKRYGTVKDIVMMCLKDGSNGTPEVGVPVGTASSDTVSQFNTFPDSQLAMLAKLRKENTELAARIAKEIAENKDGKIDKMTIISIAKQAKRTQNDMESNFIPILPDDYEKNYKDVKVRKAAEGMSINYTLDDAGKKKSHNIPLFFKWIAKQFGAVGPLVEGTMSIGDVAYADTWMPEPSIMKDMREAVAQHIARLKNLRAQFQAMSDSLNTKLKTLEDNNYNCPN